MLIPEHICVFFHFKCVAAQTMITLMSPNKLIFCLDVVKNAVPKL